MSRTVPALPWAAGALFAASFALTRLSLPFALLPALLLAYASPAFLLVAVGEAGARDPLAWLSLLAGPIVASSDWSRWHTPRLWTPLLAMWALTIAVTWPVVAGREIDFSLLAAATFDTSNGLLAPPPPIAASAITGTALSHLLGLLWLDLLWQRFGAERLGRVERWILTPLALSIVVASIGGLYQRYVDPNWLSSWQWPQLGRSASLMLDANSFGMAAAIWAPLALVLTRRLGRSLISGAAVSALLFAGAWSSGSRTAFAVSAAGVAGCFAASFAESRTWRGRLTVVVVLLAAIAAIGTAASQAIESSPLRRLIDNAPRPEDRNAARVIQIFWERDGYGLAAGRAISEHPATGVGIGAFNLLAGDFGRTAYGAMLGPDNAQNWWRQQIVELGFLGAGPSLAFSFLILLVVGSARAREDARWSALVLRVVLLGVGFISLVAVPTQQPAVWFTVLTLVFWLSALVSRSPLLATGQISSRRIWTIVMVVPLLVAADQFRSATGDLRVPVRAARIGFPYAYGFTAPDGDNVPWMGRRAVAVVPPQHAFFSWTAEGPYLTEPVRVRLWRSQRLIGDFEVSRSQPVTRIIAVPRGDKLFSLEGAITGPLPENRGLKITGQWLREVPPGTPPEIVVP
jgi:hypothetical protein